MANYIKKRQVRSYKIGEPYVSMPKHEAITSILRRKMVKEQLQKEKEQMKRDKEQKEKDSGETVGKETSPEAPKEKPKTVDELGSELKEMQSKLEDLENQRQNYVLMLKRVANKAMESAKKKQEPKPSAAQQSATPSAGREEHWTKQSHSKDRYRQEGNMYGVKRGRSWGSERENTGKSPRMSIEQGPGGMGGHSGPNHMMDRSQMGRYPQQHMGGHVQRSSMLDGGNWMGWRGGSMAQGSHMYQRANMLRGDPMRGPQGNSRPSSSLWQPSHGMQFGGGKGGGRPMMQHPPGRDYNGGQGGSDYYQNNYY